MRGIFQDQRGLFSYLSLEERVPDKHPLRKIRELRLAFTREKSQPRNGAEEMLITAAAEIAQIRKRGEDARQRIRASAWT